MKPFIMKRFEVRKIREPQFFTFSEVDVEEYRLLHSHKTFNYLSNKKFSKYEKTPKVEKSNFDYSKLKIITETDTESGLLLKLD